MDKWLVTKYIYFTFNFIFGVLFIVLGSVTYNSFPSLSSTHQQLIGNWNLPPLLDIIPIKNGICPNNSMPYKFFRSMHWPGSVEGCNCLSVSKEDAMKYQIQVKLDIGQCSDNQIKAGCKLVNATDAVELDLWEWKVSFCVTLGETSFSRNQFGNCKEGNQECYTSQGSKFCVEAGKLCPINGLYVGNVPPSSIYQNVYNLFDDIGLYYTRQGTDYPVVEGRMEEFAVCKDNSYENISPMRSDYILRSEKRVPCSVTDPRWIQLTADSEKDIYNANGLSTLESQLPLFTLSTSSNISIFYRSYIPFKDSSTCVGKVGDIVDIESNFGDLRSIQYNVIAVSILFMTILVSLIIYEFIKGSSLKNALGLGNPDTRRKVNFGAKILNFLCKLIMIPFFAIAFSASSRLCSNYETVINEKCGDFYTQEIFEDFHAYLYREVYLIDVTLLSLLTIIIVFDVVTEVFRRFGPRKHNGDNTNGLLHTNLSDYRQI